MSNIFTNIAKAFRGSNKAKQRVTVGNNSTRLGTTVIRANTQRFGVGIEEYTVAVYSADSVDYQNRVRLYDIYEDISSDSHVISVCDKRRAGVVSKIEFRKNGVPVDAVNEQIKSPWFNRFVEDAIDARFWGFSLIQFYRNEQGWIDYTLVPRKHVNLVDNVICPRQGDISGYSFDEFDDLLLIKDKNDLGRFLGIAPWVIYKRDSSGDWAQFSELFGMPIRKYTYEASDPDALSNAVRSASEQGGSAVFFCPTGTNLELIESGNNGTSCDLYDKRIDRCNAEISKTILGNTLTTESSENGTQSLGTVHAKEEDSLTRQDRDFILDILNYDMADIFAHLGIDTRGGEFVYVNENRSTPEEKQRAIETLVLKFGLPVDPDVIYETFGVEKPQSFNPNDWQMPQRMPQLPAELQNADPAEVAKIQNSLRNFFGEAPRQDGALEF